MITISILIKALWACAILSSWYLLCHVSLQQVERLELDFERTEVRTRAWQFAWILMATAATAAAVVSLMYLFNFL